MKRLVCFLAALVLCCTGCAAFADEWTVIDHEKDRNIKLAKVGVNAVTEGVSPVTGLTLADLDVPEGYAGQAATGRYMPMLVQIDNAAGGLDTMMPWGVSYADIVYELPLYSNGVTRLTYLFSDVMPDAVGPVRSARIAHAWLRQEWNGGFVHVGTQSIEGSDAGRELGKTGGLLGKTRFDGNASTGKFWMKYMVRVKGKVSPHNMSANVGELCALVPAETVPTEHAYLFTDATPMGDPATEIIVDWENEEYNHGFVYDETLNKYMRYIGSSPDAWRPYVEDVTGEHIGFSNVIIQYTKTIYNNSDGAAPITQLKTEGNADFFLGGVHMSGYWKRDGGDSRTVYYDADGQEHEMLRGNTMIICLLLNRSVRYK